MPLSQFKNSQWTLDRNDSFHSVSGHPYEIASDSLFETISSDGKIYYANALMLAGKDWVDLDALEEAMLYVFNERQRLNPNALYDKDVFKRSFEEARNPTGRRVNVDMANGFYRLYIVGPGNP